MSIRANSTRFHFDCPATGTDFRVVGFEAEQALSTAYWCELELACEQSDLKLQNLIGNAGVLTLFDPGHSGFIHGEIASASQGAVGRRFTTYHLTMRPKFWQLELRSGLRIFQDMSVPDIVQQLLKEAGISASDLKLQLTRTYKPRPYCTQYRESDFAFINRLLTEEGLFFFFEHSIARHVLVIADSKAAFTAIAGTPSLPYKPPTGMATTEEAIIQLQLQHGLRTGAVALQDYLFEKPALQLQVQDNSQPFSALQIYDYPGCYGDSSDGRQRVQQQLQAHQAGVFKISGRSDCIRLAVAHRFSLSGHPRKDANAEYTLTRLRMQGRQPQVLEEGASTEGSHFGADFEAAPASVNYRPLPLFPKPRVEGVQTAFVTGPKGEEIYTDSFGRVKVQFHWDREGRRDEKSSCWLRVSQAWAGSHWGSLVLPRIGQEVIVSFLDGDPDRPLVTGALYNAATQPPYALPGHKTRTSFKSQTTPGAGGFNELRIEDKKAGEQLFLHAEKDANLYIKHDWKQTIDHDAHLIVQKNVVDHIQNDHHRSVGSDENTRIGKTCSTSVGQDRQVKVGASHMQTVGTEWQVKSGATVMLDAGLSITLKAGAGTIVLDPSGVAITGTQVRINSGGGGASAKAARPVAPTVPARVDAGKPGEKVSSGRINDVHSVQRIPFGAGVATAPSALQQAFDNIQGGAKQFANEVIKRNAAIHAQWQAETGMAVFTDKQTGARLTPEQVQDRYEHEGRDTLPVTGAAQQEGAELVKNAPALGAAVAVAQVVGSRGREIVTHPTEFAKDITRALKDLRGPKDKQLSEALGKIGGEQAKRRQGIETDPRYTDRYHGPDDLARDPDGKLVELEYKGTKTDSKTVAKDGKGNRQGSKDKNATRATKMTKDKANKVGIPSNRQGGPYTQEEIDLWAEVQVDKGDKRHVSVHTNTETGEVKTYERNADGNPVTLLNEFKIENFEAIKSYLKELLK